MNNNTANVNKIIEIAIIGDYFNHRNIDIKSYGFGDSAINFINQYKEEYYELILSLYEEDKDILNTYTFDKYQTCFISCFAENIIKKDKIEDEEFIYFKLKLKSEKIKSYSVLRGVFGLSFQNREEPLSFGEYKIYSFLLHKNILEEKSPSDPKYIWYGDEPEYLIEWECKARHPEKAIEIADSKFKKFELILKYIIGHASEKVEVAIFNYQGWKNRRSYVLSNDQNMRQYSNYGSFQALPIDDEYFSSEDQGFKRIWQLASEANPNKFQQRILLAVEWIGQSLNDTSPQSSFLKAAISLEIIFTYNEKAIITPSILNQLSESTALIVGETVEERLEIESSVKKLYGLRSAIVHSGKDNIQNHDTSYIIQLARTVIRALLTEERYKNIKTIDELHLILKKIKYS